MGAFGFYCPGDDRDAWLRHFEVLADALTAPGIHAQDEPSEAELRDCDDFLAEFHEADWQMQLDFRDAIEEIRCLPTARAGTYPKADWTHEGLWL